METALPDVSRKERVFHAAATVPGDRLGLRVRGLSLSYFAVSSGGSKRASIITW